MTRKPANDLLSYAQAAAIVSKCAAQIARGKPQAERVKLAAAAGRVLAETLHADSDQPPFARSTRDGYACRAAEISTHRALAVAGATRAGLAPSGPLARGSVWEIMTGAPIPRGADAVAMLEHVEASGAPTAPAIRLLPPRIIESGANIVARGAQARKGAALLPAGTLIGAAQIALAASCGCNSSRRLRPPARRHPLYGRRASTHRSQTQTRPDSQLIERHAGRHGLRSRRRPLDSPHRARHRQISRRRHSPAPPQPIYCSSPAASPQANSISSSPPSPTPEHASTSPACASSPASRWSLESCRRSTALNQSQDGTKCWLGLPGNPVSSAVTFLLFAAPLVAALAGRIDREPHFALAHLTAEVKTKPGLTRFLPASCTFAAPVPEVALVPWQGSGDLAAMALANCYLVVPEDCAPSPTRRNRPHPSSLTRRSPNERREQVNKKAAHGKR